MTFSFSNLAEALKAGKPIAAEDVLAARRWAWNDGGISAAEAETIFELNTLAQDRTVEWADFFVEALVEYIVNQPPRGYVDEAKAAWLTAQIDRDGKVETLAELELIVKIMESGLNAPDSLKAYALRQIEAVILTGEGPTRRGGTIRPGVIDEAEVVLLRRLIFAAAGAGATTVSRDEAELLWRLKNACAGADNAPGWKQLFVQGVGNHLMAHNLYRPLERSEAERLEAFMGDHSVDIGRFLTRMATSLPKAPIREAFARPAAETSHDERVAADRAISDGEGGWLKQHVDADGSLDPLEQALLDFITEESGTTLDG